MKAQWLPYEIYLKIFQHLNTAWPPKRDLTNCSTICKSWSSAAIQMLYQDIEIYGDDVLELKKVYLKMQLNILLFNMVSLYRKFLDRLRSRI